MKSTTELKNEHSGIELMLRVLQTVADKIARGENVDTAHLDGILEFLTVFVDKCHHGKEEEFLFPALESAGVPRQGGPIGVMLHEHEEGRKLIAGLKQAVERLKSGDKTEAANFRRIVIDYVTLLTQHIAKENTVLFPMADTRLDSDSDARLYDAFEKRERERIGIGKHEEFHGLLDNLEKIYLA